MCDKCCNLTLFLHLMLRTKLNSTRCKHKVGFCILYSKKVSSFRQDLKSKCRILTYNSGSTMMSHKLAMKKIIFIIENVLAQLTSLTQLETPMLANIRSSLYRSWFQRPYSIQMRLHFAALKVNSPNSIEVVLSSKKV